MNSHYLKLFSVLLTLSIVLNSCSQKNVIEKREMALAKNWQVFSAGSETYHGELVSTNDFVPKDFLNAEIPSTVFNAQVKNGVYTDIYRGKNLETISTKAFKNPWWFRKVFKVGNAQNYYELEFDGINYKANIWLNGKLIADTLQIDNAFKIYRLDVSKEIVSGKNTLAVEVFPPKAGDFSIGFVDWNPAPPDQNMGVFRPVILHSIYKLQITEPIVESSFENNDYSKANLTASLKVKNYTNEPVNGLVDVEINGKRIKKEISLAANTTKKVILTPQEFPVLRIDKPTLWWPHTMGEPILHDAQFSFSIDGDLIDNVSVKYGIREIKDYYTDDGHRGFMINGQKISIRGGGWVDNIMLNNTHDYDLAQLEYVKSMNLNTIRMEGFWGKDDFLYKKCDELGILIMVGWSCHWEWENYLGKYCDEKYGGILSDKDINMMSTAWRDQIVWLRNHPSIFAWFSGSDCVPTPKLEEKYMETFNEYDSTRIYLSSAKEWESSSINTGIKMRGPYAYTPPIYWFADTLYGGAFGFNSETGPGAQVPPLESIQKMIPKKDLWPINDVWNFHCGRNEFNTLNRYTEALNNRYGKSNSVEEYVQKAQLMNYELMRPMFEAFSANRFKATGVIQWMLNSAWPEMYWQLYDSYLMPNGAFYATKKAGEPLHALYNYNTNSIYLVNDILKGEEDVSVRISIYNINSKLLFDKKVKTNIKSNSSKELIQLPEIMNNSKTWFLDLRVDKGGMEVANNFYWLSEKKDLLDYDAKVPNWYYHTPSKQYADFTALNEMPKAEVAADFKRNQRKDKVEFSVDLKNKTNKIAFFIHPNIIDNQTGSTILPVIWSDNYISLLPGEKRELKAFINNKYLKNTEPVLILKGYNLKETQTHK